MEKYIEFVKKNDNIIEKKYMIFNSGLYGREEIYKYADLIWNTFIRMPYLLDGIIFTNTTIPYIKKKGSIYKWKPDEYNSIDFYIKFKKNEKKQIEYNEANKVCQIFLCFLFTRSSHRSAAKEEKAFCCLFGNFPRFVPYLQWPTPNLERDYLAPVLVFLYLGT